MGKGLHWPEDRRARVSTVSPLWPGEPSPLPDLLPPVSLPSDPPLNPSTPWGRDPDPHFRRNGRSKAGLKVQTPSPIRWGELNKGGVQR